MERLKELNEFLKELAELTKKYGFKIWGCGCCRSPLLEDMRTSNSRPAADYLDYDEEKQEYTCSINEYWEGGED